MIAPEIMGETKDFGSRKKKQFFNFKLKTTFLGPRRRIWAPFVRRNMARNRKEPIKFDSGEYHFWKVRLIRARYDGIGTYDMEVFFGGREWIYTQQRALL